MTSLFNYLFESGATLAVFYLFYAWLLKNQSNFRVNRIYLLTSTIFALILPFIEVAVERTSEFVNAGQFFLSPVIVGTEAAAHTSAWDLAGMVLIIYLSGSLVILGFLLVQHRELFRLWNSGIVRSYGDYKLICTDSDQAPFSWFNHIFVHSSDWDDPLRFRFILKHEQTHAQKLHTLDNYLINLVTVILWFNPFVWLIKRALRNVHEYEADQRTVENSERPDYYKRLLFSQAMGVDSLSLVNNFHSSIKNRLLMLHKKSSSSDLFRGLVFVPLALAMLFVFSCNEQEEGASKRMAPPPDESGEKVIVDNSPDENTVSPDKEKEQTKIFKVVEDMPQFRGGGIPNFRKYIQKQIEYPEEAIQKGIEGIVFVKFVVTRKGENTDVEVVRGVHELLDDMALEAVKNAPDWEPGKQRGKNVNVQFTIPVRFELD